MSTPNFKPRMIGTPDQLLINVMNQMYQDICDRANDIKVDLEVMFDNPDKELFDKFMESEPVYFIRSKWVAFKGISIPGINIEKLIESDLLDIPKYDEIIKSRKDLDKLLVESKDFKFTYNLDDLYNEDDALFELNDQFHATLLENMTEYTKNEEQNKALEGFELMRKGINMLVDLGYLRVNNLRSIHDEYYGRILKRSDRDHEAFELNNKLFTLLRKRGNVE